MSRSLISQFEWVTGALVNAELISNARIGHYMPCIDMKRKVSIVEFLRLNPVFSLDKAAAAFSEAEHRSRTVERLKHYLETGRLTRPVREVYAVPPPGVSPDQFHPDPILVATATRPDAVFSHHTALELLGVAHSVWNQCSAYTDTPRRPFTLDGTKVLFLQPHKAFRGSNQKHLGTRRVERSGQTVETTGPERTIVDSFRRPALAGGLEELVTSAGGFSTLDLKLLEKVLTIYDTANLWAATGWFLERFAPTFHVPDSTLARFERHRPRSPQYLDRGTRGGVLARRWNLILPQTTAGQGEPDER